MSNFIEPVYVTTESGPPPPPGAVPPYFQRFVPYAHFNAHHHHEDGTAHHHHHHEGDVAASEEEEEAKNTPLQIVLQRAQQNEMVQGLTQSPTKRIRLTCILAMVLLLGIVVTLGQKAQKM